MKIFLDTSSLFKLYHYEADTPTIEQIFSKIKVTTVYLSEITKVEFASSIWKKVRIKEITEAEAKTTLALFKADSNKYTFIATDSVIIEQATNLIEKYGSKGLRTLDSIQLSTSIFLVKQAGLFVTSDILLKSLLTEEKLPTELTAIL